MEQLHITLVSKELKYNLSNLKIKTLQKAKQYLPKCNDPHKSAKIQVHLALYDQIKSNAKKKLFQTTQQQKQIDLEQSQLQQKNKQKQHIFYSCLTTPCLTQIFGSKSTGKTALLIHLAQKYNEFYPSKNVKIINCASGFTGKRYQSLSQKCQLTYCDAFNLDNAINAVETAQKEGNVSCLIIDSLTNLLMAQQKTRIYLVKFYGILERLVQKKVTVLISNYMQQRIQYKTKLNCHNNFSYFSAITSEFVKYKYFLNRQPKRKLTEVTMVKGGNLFAQIKIGSTGVNEIRFL